MNILISDARRFVDNSIDSFVIFSNNWYVWVFIFLFFSCFGRFYYFHFFFFNLDLAKSDLECVYSDGSFSQSEKSSNVSVKNELIESKQIITKCNESELYCYTAWIQVNESLLIQSQGKFFCVFYSLTSILY